MGSNESQNCIYYDMYSSLAIVALSAQPPGVNELCVCVCVYSVQEKKEEVRLTVHHEPR